MTKCVHSSSKDPLCASNLLHNVALVQLHVWLCGAALLVVLSSLSILFVVTFCGALLGCVFVAVRGCNDSGGADPENCAGNLRAPWRNGVPPSLPEGAVHLLCWVQHVSLFAPYAVLRCREVERQRLCLLHTCRWVQHLRSWTLDRSACGSWLN